MTVVRVVVVRSGGFAGLTRTAEVDDPDAAQRLSASVLRSTERASDRSRDAFVYEFTLVGSSSSRTVDLGESALPPELRAVIRSLFS